MATAHLLFGYIAVGKTSFAEKNAAIIALMEPLWRGCLRHGVDVVLDYGFWARVERDHARQLARSTGAEVLLYRLNCPDKVAQARIAACNQSSKRSLYVVPATYEGLKARIAPLEADETVIDVPG